MGSNCVKREARDELREGEIVTARPRTDDAPHPAGQHWVLACTLPLWSERDGWVITVITITIVTTVTIFTTVIIITNLRSKIPTATFMFPWKINTGGKQIDGGGVIWGGREGAEKPQMALQINCF